jgi:hypothetical protein
MTTTDSITAAFDALCRRAGVAPTDDSQAAGLAVCAVLARDGVFTDRDSPDPVGAWLTQTAGLTARFVIVTTMGVRLGTREGPKLRWETVPMCAALTAAMRACTGRNGALCDPAPKPRTPGKRKRKYKRKAA